MKCAMSSSLHIWREIIKVLRIYIIPIQDQLDRANAHHIIKYSGSSNDTCLESNATVSIEIEWNKAELNQIGKYNE